MFSQWEANSMLRVTFVYGNGFPIVLRINWICINDKVFFRFHWSRTNWGEWRFERLLMLRGAKSGSSGGLKEGEPTWPQTKDICSTGAKHRTDLFPFSSSRYSVKRKDHSLMKEKHFLFARILQKFKKDWRSFKFIVLYYIGNILLPRSSSL